MAHAEMLWKTTQCKINGQSKPFIDENLQIQIPGLDSTCEPPMVSAHKSIYSHYCQDPFVITPEMAAIESELNTAIAEAQQTYEVWKKMQAQLLEASNQLTKKSK